MAIYYVSVGKNEYQIEIKNNECIINGETVQASLVALQERGLYVLQHEAWQREMHVQAQGNGQYSLDINGRHTVAKVEKRNSYRPHQTNLVGVGDLIAPMPGIVVNVQVEEGDIVTAGQVLVVLESMKMQMSLRTPCAGTVIQVNARPNLQCSKDALLVKIDPSISCDD